VTAVFVHRGCSSISIFGPVFLSHRRTAVDALGASLETHAAVHTRYRVHVVGNRNIVSEDALSMRAFDRKGQVGRPVVTVVLDGHARLTAYDQRRWLSRGGVSLIESKSAIVMRQGKSGEPFASVAIEWDVGSLGPVRPKGFTVDQLSERALESFAQEARTLTASDVGADAAAQAIARMLGILRGFGAPFDEPRPETLIEEVPEQTLRLAHALDVLLSDLRRRPMVVDLDQVLGLSTRQINRIVTAFNARYGFNSVGWLDTRSRRRLMMGAALMTASGADTETIAAAVGYGSPAAFCRALSEAGLPSPGAIAKAVRDLI
jgi:AraC-like DNA-binding protein